MELLSLGLKNFRNFSQKKIDFDPKLTVIIGPNGSGKTNILEAVLLLSGVRSAKVETDLDLVKFAKSEAKIEGEAAEIGVKNKLTLNMQVFDERIVNKDYWRNIGAYQKIIARRNKLLIRIMEGKAKKAELDFWDLRLLEHGAIVC